MILVNVLAMVAVAATVATLMADAESPALDRALRLREASRALAVARGGELSALVALRRDAVAAPESDDRTEAWARTAQASVAIDDGRFTLAIADAQARFNVNAAATGGEPVLAAITAALGLKGDIASRIAGVVAAAPVSDLAELRRAGIDAPTIAALRRLVTALPGTAEVNVNAAGAELLGILFGDPVAGRALAERRDRAGRLTPTDLAAAGVALPAGMGFVSDHYVATTTVTIGATTQVLASLIERRPGAAVVIARSRGQPSR